MTHYGTEKSFYSAWGVYSNGRADSWRLTNSPVAVRPVFYLNSDTTISGGEGTVGNPYIIN